jgi:enamine deaminase RidA (YjgF/YER057c/UK114 family)
VSVYEKLDAPNITFPELTPPVAAFVPFLRSGNLLFSSGHIAKIGGRPWVGQLGGNLTTEQGKNAARGVAIDLMGTLHAAVGDLNQIKRNVKLMVLLNSTPTFTEQHLVANGASELFGEVLEILGTLGVVQIPFGPAWKLNWSRSFSERVEMQVYTDERMTSR